VLHSSECKRNKVITHWCRLSSLWNYLILYSTLNVLPVVMHQCEVSRSYIKIFIQKTVYTTIWRKVLPRLHGLVEARFIFSKFATCTVQRGRGNFVSVPMPASHGKLEGRKEAKEANRLSNFGRLQAPLWSISNGPFATKPWRVLSSTMMKTNYLRSTDSLKLAVLHFMSWKESILMMKCMVHAARMGESHVDYLG
jgi:hypothetical protein